MYNWYALHIIQLESKLTLIQKHIDKYKKDVFINYNAVSQDKQARIIFKEHLHGIIYN
jgi:hypothetical protein